MISESTIKRLPRYYRYSMDLLGNDILRISSGELAEMMGITPSQVRQDLSSIGQFGTAGYGYNVRILFEGIRKVIGLTNGYNVVIVGMNNLGKTIMQSQFMKYRGIKVRGLFDYCDSVGEIVEGKKVQSIVELKDFCLENAIDVAILCVDENLSEEACSIAVAGGVSGIWNLTGGELRLERCARKVEIVNVNLFDSLAKLFCAL